MLQFHTASQIASHTAPRQGEQKIGQEIECLNSLDQLASSPAQFVILGLREDIGIRANLGVAGAAHAYKPFLTAFLNMQSNGYVNAKKIALAGSLNFDSLMEQSRSLNQNKASELDKLRGFTAQIDEQVSAVVQKIVASGKTPIIIGGGHNNCYGNISGASQALNQKINVLNIDPHADYRAMEGRHSGNGFRYAHAHGFINRYGVWGLFPAYNNSEILRAFQEDENLHFVSFEELLALGTQEKDRLFKNLLHWLGLQHVGLELDMDSLTNFPVSALNPSGFHLNEIRHLVKTTAALRAPVYFHLCEASPGRAQHATDEQMLGKSLALLVWDFIHSYSSSSKG